MKKGILITAGVVALLALMVWADRKFPACWTARGECAQARPTLRQMPRPLP